MVIFTLQKKEEAKSTYCNVNIWNWKDGLTNFSLNECVLNLITIQWYKLIEDFKFVLVGYSHSKTEFHPWRIIKSMLCYVLGIIHCEALTVKNDLKKKLDFILENSDCER